MISAASAWRTSAASARVGRAWSAAEEVQAVRAARQATATVTGGAVPAGPPTGTVTFLIGGSPAGTGTLSNGTAAFTTSGLTAGTHQVTARYEGDATFAASTSDAVAVTVNPVTPPPAVRLFGTGAGPGGGPHVRAFNPDGSERFSFFAYEPDFTGGVAVAFGDVTGDGTDDLITGAGPGALPQVKLFDGATRALIRTIDAFEPSFTGGVYVAAADLDADGKADFVVTPGEGGGPRVRIFRGGDFAQLNDFFGIEDPAFRGGARAALADVNGDVRTDLLVAAGFGGGPRVATFDGVSVATGNPSLAKLFGDIFVFEDTLRNGVFITAGDLDGDGFAEVIAGGGPGSGPRVFALSGRELVESGAQVAAANFFAGDVANRGGIRVVAKDFDGDGRADLVAGAGTGAPPVVTRYRGADIPAEGTPPELDSFLAGPPDFLGGVFVG